MIKVNIIVICVISAVLLAILYRSTFNKKGIPASQKWSFLLTLAYMLVIYGVSFSNFSIAPYDRQRIVNLLPLVNSFKLLTEYGFSNFALNVLGAIALYIPLGILLPASFKNLNSLAKTAGTSLLLTFTIEIWQFVFATRVFDIDDFILDTVGATIGFVLYKKLKGSDKRRDLGKRFKFNGFTVIVLSLVFALSAFVVMTVSFFVHTVSSITYNKTVVADHGRVIQENDDKHHVYILINDKDGIRMDIYKKLPLFRYQKVYEGKGLKEPGTYDLGIYKIAPDSNIDKYYSDKEWKAPLAVYGHLDKNYNVATAYFDTKEKTAQIDREAFVLTANRSVYGQLVDGKPYMLKVLEKNKNGSVYPLRYYKDPKPTKPDNLKPVRATYSVKDGKFTAGKGDIKETIVPASVEKLYTIYYATSILDLDEKVYVDEGILKLTKEGSSIAGLEPGNFTVKEIIAGMLVPSGNDAALTLAVTAADKRYGKKLDPATAVVLFAEDANYYLKEKGLKNTRMSDPSGYSYTDVTTVEDMNKVTKELIKHEWFTDIVKEKTYQTVTPDKEKYTWSNTNGFLYPKSEVYNKNVKGIKTGSLDTYYNLSTLYYKGGEQYLMYDFGETDKSKIYTETKKLIEGI